MDVLKGDPDSDSETNPVSLKKQFEFVDIKELPAIWKGMKDDPLKIEVCKEETKPDVIIIEEHEVVDEISAVKMASTSAACDPKRKRILNQPELQRTVDNSDSDYIYSSDSSSDFECESEGKSESSESSQECDDTEWRKVGVRDVEPKRHAFTVTGTGPQVNLTTENTPKDYLKLFLTENLVEGFVGETNRYANNSISSKQLSPRSIWSTWKDVTVTEFWCFLATVINIGIIRQPNLTDYWSQEWTHHVPFFNDVLSRDRFMQIFWMLHLSPTPPATGPLTKTNRIHNYLQYLEEKFRFYFVPNQALSVDESTISFREQISFKTYNPKKPTKGGMRIYMLTDSATGYICTFVPYYGKHTTDELDRPDLPFSTRIVLHLYSKLCQTVQNAAGYHIYTDRYYTSINLAKELGKMKCHITGTIMSNRKDNPSGIKAKIPLHETRAYRSGDILILAWRDKKMVLMCSTWHTAETEAISRKNKEEKTNEIFQKPCVISDYTKKMGGVDTADHYTSTYCFLRKSIKWWRKLFFWGLDAAIVNAYHLYRLKTSDAAKKPMTHLQFRRKLVTELSADRKTVRGSKKRGRPSSSDREERLDGNQHFIYSNEYSNSKDCVACSNRKIKGGRRETVFYCATCSRKPGLHPGICFEVYHTKVNYKCQY